MSLIANGDYVVIQGKSQISLYQLPKKEGKNMAIKFGRNQVELSSAAGKPFGAFRLVGTGKKRLLEPTDSLCEIKEELMKNVCSGENNQDIWDDGTSQQLKKEDIDQLKQQGISGSEIVSQLVENSKTFQIKTEFSQEKYLNKKEEKYSEYLEILQPSIRLLSRHFYSQDPMKILNLRTDTLAMINSLANIKPGGSYAVLDGGCQGLLVASILDRIQGDGVVWNLHPKGPPQRQAVDAMNFNEEQKKPLRSMSLTKLRVLLSAADNELEEDSEVPSKVMKLDEEAVQLENTAPKLELGSLDGLIVACRRPSTVVKQLIRLLAPSRNFAIFCPYIEPLAETYIQMRENNLAVNLKLVESWMRYYQVLPMRTHPEVMMSGSGGYLLSGINVIA